MRKRFTSVARGDRLTAQTVNEWQQTIGRNDNTMLGDGLAGIATDPWSALQLVKPNNIKLVRMTADSISMSPDRLPLPSSSPDGEVDLFNAVEMSYDEDAGEWVDLVDGEMDVDNPYGLVYNTDDPVVCFLHDSGRWVIIPHDEVRLAITAKDPVGLDTDDTEGFYPLATDNPNVYPITFIDSPFEQIPGSSPINTVPKTAPSGPHATVMNIRPGSPYLEEGTIIVVFAISGQWYTWSGDQPIIRVVNLTADYTVTLFDELKLFSVDASGGSVIVRTPNVAESKIRPGFSFYVQRSDDSSTGTTSKTVSVSCSNSNFFDAVTAVRYITPRYATYQIIWNGQYWNMIPYQWWRTRDMYTNYTVSEADHMTIFKVGDGLSDHDVSFPVPPVDHFKMGFLHKNFPFKTTLLLGTFNTYTMQYQNEYVEVTYNRNAGEINPTSVYVPTIAHGLYFGEWSTTFQSFLGQQAIYFGIAQNKGMSITYPTQSTMYDPQGNQHNTAFFDIAFAGPTAKGGLITNQPQTIGGLKDFQDGLAVGPNGSYWYDGTRNVFVGPVTFGSPTSYVTGYCFGVGAGAVPGGTSNVGIVYDPTNHRILFVNGEFGVYPKLAVGNLFTYLDGQSGSIGGATFTSGLWTGGAWTPGYTGTLGG